MRTVKITIEGIVPLRMNRYIHEKKQPTKPTDSWLREDAFDRCYKDDKGYYIPKQALRKVILNGAGKVRHGRGRAKADMSAVFFPQTHGYLEKGCKPELGDIEIVRIPPGPKGARVPKYFAYFQGWGTTFEAAVTDDSIPLETIKDSAIAGGLYFGLLDGRPEYGRYMVTKFDISEGHG